MASVTCAKCGQVWLRAEDVGFCAKCGAALFNSKATVQPEADTLKETPKKKASIAWGPTILAFSVIFALIFGILAAATKSPRAISALAGSYSAFLLLIANACFTAIDITTKIQIRKF